MTKWKYKSGLLWVVLLLPYLTLIPAFWWYNKMLRDVKDSTFIIISKQEMMLYHYNYKAELLQKSPIACGKNFGNKNGIGDLKTPEGVFTLGTVKEASTWSHDFKDDSLGKLPGLMGLIS
jgi:hypothetical protein